MGTQEIQKNKITEKNYNQQYNFQIFLNTTGPSSLAAQTEVNQHSWLSQHALAGPVIFPKGDTLLPNIYINIIPLLECCIYCSCTCENKGNWSCIKSTVPLWLIRIWHWNLACSHHLDICSHVWNVIVIGDGRKISGYLLIWHGMTLLKSIKFAMWQGTV